MTLAQPLLDWFHAHKREMPWRTDGRDPYAVWVSEVMLQQTTVATATGFFLRWMDALPTLQTLADADLDTVLHLWQGLGYYARARNLHKGARFVVDNFGGCVPPGVNELLTVPGIGRYTAGAIASLAFNKPAPIVDANVARVLCRVLQLEGDPKTDSKTQAALWQHAAELIPDGQAGVFNEALMELGALVCVPKGPRCEHCPLASQCAAFQSGRVGEFPQFAEKKQKGNETHVSVAVVDAAGNILLVQRPQTAALWGGLWELPRAVSRDGECSEDAAVRAISDAAGLALTHAVPFGVVKHIVANRRIVLRGFAGVVYNPRRAALTKNSAALAWAALPDLKNYALSTPQRQLLQQWETHLSQPRLELE